MDVPTNVKYRNKSVKDNEGVRVLERLQMPFSVMLREEAIIRNTTPSGT